MLAGQKAALQYARQHLVKFQGSHMQDIQRVMGALCFARRAGSTPYADLNTPAQWGDVAREFARQCCGLLGQVNPLNCPLRPMVPLWGPIMDEQMLTRLLVVLNG